LWSAKAAESARVKSWEIIADRVSAAGWSWGCVATINSNGQTIFVAAAHRGDGKRYVVRADEKLTAFVELESTPQRWITLRSRDEAAVLDEVSVLGWASVSTSASLWG
jgi:hypothetical protein